MNLALLVGLETTWLVTTMAMAFALAVSIGSLVKDLLAINRHHE
jgi:hypothetical protein